MAINISVKYNDGGLLPDFLLLLPKVTTTIGEPV